MRRLLTALTVAAVGAVAIATSVLPAAAAGPAGANVPGYKVGVFPIGCDGGVTSPCVKHIAQNTPFYVLQWWDNSDNSLTPKQLSTVFFNVWVDATKEKGQVWQQFDNSAKPPVLMGRGNLYSYGKGWAPGTYQVHWTLGWNSTDYYSGDVTLVAEACTTTKIMCGQ
jgi:hypothetical protein